MEKMQQIHYIISVYLHYFRVNFSRKFSRRISVKFEQTTPDIDHWYLISTTIKSAGRYQVTVVDIWLRVIFQYIDFVTSYFNIKLSDEALKPNKLDYLEYVRAGNSLVLV